MGMTVAESVSTVCIFTPAICYIIRLSIKEGLKVRLWTLQESPAF